MNLNRKIDMQERTIKSLQEKNEKLRSENRALRTENAKLSDSTASKLLAVWMPYVLSGMQEFKKLLNIENSIKMLYLLSVKYARNMKRSLIS